MSDFYKSDVAFLQVGCRIFTSRMSDFNKSDGGCRIFKVGCRMAPISFWHMEINASSSASTV